MAMPAERYVTLTVPMRLARARNYLARTWPLYAMFVPGLVALAVFSYYPMYGVVMAFQDYNPGLGFLRSPWVGLENFRSIFSNPDFYNIVRNSFIIATTKIVTLQVAAVVLALLLNEVASTRLKRTLQTILYLPYFLSWVVLGGILLDMLSSRGVVAQGFRALGLESPMFLGSNTWFVPTLVVTNIWQSVGWSTIIFLAALTAVDPQLHEAAAIDGAGRWQRVRHVTLPGIASTVVLVACLNLGNVLQAGFDQVFTLYNPAVYATGDILDTYVYRVGLISARYSLGAAIGLFKSVMGFILIVAAYRLADKTAGYSIF
jgi:putative aldouronate transport system permease protein